MGARGNLGFRSAGESTIYLYTHWRGHELEELAAEAVRAAQPRWGDPSYATRMALTALIGGVTDDLGYGVSTEPEDNEFPLIVIDWNARTVEIEDEPPRTLTFAELLAAE